MHAYTLEPLAIGTISTVGGGLCLALFLFLIKEKLCPLPDIVGRWHFEMQTENTSYRPYQDMIESYVAMLWREGHVVHGTVEKIHEKSSTGEREYVGEHRTRGQVHGYIDKNYLGKDRLFLHITEAGERRDSTRFHELTFGSKGRMVGTFTSTVAEQEGAVSWRRESPHSAFAIAIGALYLAREGC